LSIARGLGMCHQQINNYFTILLQICQKNGFQANPNEIFSMDECDLQMNGEQSKIVANKGSREVHRIPSGEKG
jgi:hypothetical protein